MEQNEAIKMIFLNMIDCKPGLVSLAFNDLCLASAVFLFLVKKNKIQDSCPVQSLLFEASRLAKPFMPQITLSLKIILLGKVGQARGHILLSWLRAD